MILDFLFPKNCLGCGFVGFYLCSKCISKVGLILNFPNSRDISVWRYDGVIRKAIVSLKYNFTHDLSSEISELASQSLTNIKFIPSCNVVLLPVPLQRDRLNWRGFNQTEVIGKKISKLMSWEFNTKILSKIKRTKTQVGLDRKSRQGNLNGSFFVNSQLLEPNKKYIIFDDVWTTGSTIGEIKKELGKFVDNSNIYSLTIARG